jgi:uncharacterized membrane protein
LTAIVFRKGMGIKDPAMHIRAAHAMVHHLNEITYDRSNLLNLSFHTEKIYRIFLKKVLTGSLGLVMIVSISCSSSIFSMGLR